MRISARSGGDQDRRPGTGVAEQPRADEIHGRLPPAGALDEEDPTALLDDGLDRLPLAGEADAVSSADDMEPQGWLRGTRAKALARLGRVDEAETEARENVRLMEPTDWLPYRAMAWFDLGEVLRIAGRTDEALEAYRTAEELYEQKGSSLLSARARTAREALDASR